MDSKARELDLLLGRLRLADGASFDSGRSQPESLCKADTRVEILQQLQEWSSSPQTPILWLSGMAGTGKSTIAQTMADKLHTQNKLAGSFFFSRGVGSLSKAANFVTTLAHQLACFSPPRASPAFKELVCEAILARSNVLAQGLRNQWRELIVRPISRFQSTQRIVLTFVIDAMDECDSEDDIRLLLQLFTELKNINTVDLSVLMTSRPEITLLHGFQDMPEIMHRRLDLRDVPQDEVELDIYVFMKEKLRRKKGKTESQDWLSENDLLSLVQKADCLFIYAATVCRFIQNSHYVPKDRISAILMNRSTGSGDIAVIDAMYTQILSSALAKPEQRISETEWLTDRFKGVVGSIVALLDVLSVIALSDLLSMEVTTVEITLDSLESVLNIPRDITEPIHLLHPSFREFLLNEARCEDERFHVQRGTVNTHLALISPFVV